MFKEYGLSGIPRNDGLERYRMWLLQQIGIVSAYHYQILSPTSIIFLFHRTKGSSSSFLQYIGNRLKQELEEKHIPHDGIELVIGEI